ncbi:uncharacterized protein FFMR_08829 [Fusarium fujikuroi]|nr:uncharacterized protein FFMR_08829 [Fusarium fujikuroi]
MRFSCSTSRSNALKQRERDRGRKRRQQLRQQSRAQQLLEADSHETVRLVSQIHHGEADITDSHLHEHCCLGHPATSSFSTQHLPPETSAFRDSSVGYNTSLRVPPTVALSAAPVTRSPTYTRRTNSATCDDADLTSVGELLRRGSFEAVAAAIPDLSDADEERATADRPRRDSALSECELMSPRVRPYHARQHSLTILQTAQPQDGGPLSNWVVSENQCSAQSISYPLRNDPTSAVSPHQGYAELAVGGWRGTDPGSTASSITSGLGFAPFDHTTDHFPVAAVPAFDPQLGSPAGHQQQQPSSSDSAKPWKPSPPSFTEVNSVRRQAEPYRLAIAEFPINLLTSSWSRSTNRPLDRNHVAHLCRSFRQGNLTRRAEENYIQVTCSATAVDSIISTIAGSDRHADNHPVLSFKHWADVNDEKPELMTGQHRIEALRDYVEQTSSGSDDLWWTCEFYNKDTLPVELDIKLRTNRRDLTLPDSHGQIWLQLASASDRDPTLFSSAKNKNKQALERRMLDILCLRSEIRFPISRLVTLWKNERWRPMITRWCQTQIGRATFNISIWDCMASYRIDDYLFGTFYQVLETLKTLPTPAVESIQVSDWAKLATDLGNSTYTAADVHQLFYPKDSSNGDDLAAPTSRPTGFFSSLDRKAYHDLFRHIIQHNPTLPFADVQSLLRIKKDEGEIMTRVIDHVVLWINARPIDIVNRHDNNKPLRRQDLMPAIERLMATACGADWWAQLRERGGGDGGTEDIAAWLELRSQSLEKQILDYVRLHMARFKDPSTTQYLALMPEEEHDHSYAERFATDDLWLGLFRVVQNTIGPAFRPTWQDSVSDRVGDLHGGDEAHNLDSETRRGPASAITRAICSQLGNIPEVMENPALCGVYASTELGTYIDQAVLTWAADRCRKAVEKNESDDGAPWPDEALRMIQMAYQEYERILSGMAATACSDDQQRRQPSQGFTLINKTSGAQRCNSRAREAARLVDLSLMQQSSYAATSPSPQYLQSSENHHKGSKQGQEAAGYSPSQQVYPATETGHPLPLPGEPVRGTWITQSRRGRNSLSTGQRNLGRSDLAKRNASSSSQTVG